MIRVIQIIDSLHVGGAERMAVNIANSITNYNVESHICTTREEGQLKGSIDSEVSYFFLKKKSALDFKAILRLKNYIEKHQINVIHAHGTSFFIAVLVKYFVWDLKLVWHDHFGNRVNDTSILRLAVLKFCSFNFNLIYCVNNELKLWAIENLNCKKVEFISNYPIINQKKETKLSGIDGKRVLCTANLREPKNHLLLFNAFNEIIKEYNDWSLHCIGNIYDDIYSENLKKFILQNNLENHIFLYGAKDDVSHIMSQCNIGVLTSTFEGLPMVLLEYGLCKLPVLATNVGFCGNLIQDSSYGVLIPSNDKEALHSGLKLYITNTGYRNDCAKKFHEKIVNEFSEVVTLNTLVEDYKTIIEYENSRII